MVLVTFKNRNMNFWKRFDYFFMVVFNLINWLHGVNATGPKITFGMHLNSYGFSITIGPLFLIILIFLCVLCCCMRRERQDSNTIDDLNNMEDKKDVVAVAPANGIYIVEFMKPGTMNQPEHLYTNEMNIKFVSYQDGWTIHGNGNDNDGRIVILGGGFVDINGKASWKEKIGTDTEVSSIGRFNFHNHTFTGAINWGNYVSNPYIKFYHKLTAERLSLNKSVVATTAII